VLIIAFLGNATDFPTDNFTPIETASTVVILILLCIKVPSKIARPFKKGCGRPPQPLHPCTQLTATIGCYSPMPPSVSTPHFLVLILLSLSMISESWACEQPLQPTRITRSILVSIDTPTTWRTRLHMVHQYIFLIIYPHKRTNVWIQTLRQRDNVAMIATISHLRVLCKPSSRPIIMPLIMQVPSSSTSGRSLST